MLDFQTARIIKDAINKYLGYEVATLEDVHRMQVIPYGTKGSDYTILALQNGNLTILVWLRVTDSRGAFVEKVCSQSW